MAGNYITNVNLLVFPNGRKFEKLLDPDLKQSEKDTALDLIITEAENWVDSQLKGRTAIPATHVLSDCKQIALEYARALMFRDNPIITDDDKEKRAKQYFEQAENFIKLLQFGASVLQWRQHPMEVTGYASPSLRNVAAHRRRSRGPDRGETRSDHRRTGRGADNEVARAATRDGR